jgi:hypothetical protein
MHKIYLNGTLMLGDTAVQCASSGICHSGFQPGLHCKWRSRTVCAPECMPQCLPQMRRMLSAEHAARLSTSLQAAALSAAPATGAHCEGVLCLKLANLCLWWLPTCSGVCQVQCAGVEVGQSDPACNCISVVISHCHMMVAVSSYL